VALASRQRRRLFELLDAADAPSAIILGGNQLLEGALAAVHRRGLQLGRDLSLVCCDDVPLSRFHQPPIATVMRDATLLGKRAAQVLLAQIEAPGASDPVTLPTWFEARASCAPLHPALHAGLNDARRKRTPRKVDATHG